MRTLTMAAGLVCYFAVDPSQGVLTTTEKVDAGRTAVTITATGRDGAPHAACRFVLQDGEAIEHSSVTETDGTLRIRLESP